MLQISILIIGLVEPVVYVSPQEQTTWASGWYSGCMVVFI